METPGSPSPRQDPAKSPLRYQETAGLYEAFRLRRTMASRRGLFLARVFRAAGIDLFPTLLLCAYGVTALVLYQLFPFGVVPMALVFVVAMLLYRRLRKEESGMPRSLTLLLSQGIRYRQAMLDIWMTGAGGWQVGEALRRESIESARWAGVSVSLVACLLGSAPYWFLRHWRVLPAAVLWASIFAFCMLLVRLAKLWLENMGPLTVLREWKREFDPPQLTFVKTFGLLILIVVGSIPVTGVIVGIILAFAALRKSLPPTLSTLAGEYLIAACLLVGIALLWPLHGWIDRWGERYRQARLREIVDLYNRYVRLRVIQDADAR